MASGTGTVTVNFGTGKAEAKATITGLTSITTTSLVEAWVGGDNSTADHSSDEHMLEEFICWPANLVNAVGFDVYVRPTKGICKGQYKINYVWNTG